MAPSGLADFWRRRRLPILVGLIVLCIIVTFMHMRSRGLRKHQQVDSLRKNNAPDHEKHVKPLPPMHDFVKSGDDAKGLDKWKERVIGADGKGLDMWKELGKGDKSADLEEGWKKDSLNGVPDEPAVVLDGNIGDGDGDGDDNLFPGEKKDGGFKDGDIEGVKDGEEGFKDDEEGFKDGGEGFKDGGEGFKDGGEGFKDGDLEGFKDGGEGFKDGGEGFKDGGEGFKDGEDGFKDGDLEKGGDAFGEAWAVDPGDQPLQPKDVPVQNDELAPAVGQLPVDVPVQPVDVPVQPVDVPVQPVDQSQPFNVPVQPVDVPVQPVDVPVQPVDVPVQPVDVPIQPVDVPVQPVDVPVQPVNVPVQPVDVPVQPANPTANVPVQPVNQPENPPVQPAQPPDAPWNVPVPAQELYLKSTMTLGRPLPSRKTDRQAAVVRAFQHAWKGYKDHAWGKDDLNPISHSSSSSYFNMGMTLVDSLDTIWLMGLEQEFGEAREWVAQSLDFDHSVKTVSLFETNIRVLGGLLSAYHLSQDRMFLDKAIKLGSRLLPAFQTPSGVPFNTVTLSNAGHGGRTISTAEAGTLQLEFRDLSRASGNPVYAEKCDKAMDKMLSQTRGIVLQSLNSNSGMYSGSVYSAGAGTDSYYEYLIKQWIQSGMTEDKFRDAYTTAVPEVLEHLVGYSQPSHMAYLGKRFSLNSRQLPSPVMDHLSCFFPGMLALGVEYSVLPNTRSIAANLTHTCYHMYHSTFPTGIAPEIFQFNVNSIGASDTVKSSDSQNLQRPETVESLFYMYRLTKDERYREWGWEIFQAFEKYTKVEGGGYACLKSVYTAGNFRDRMESFFLTETLKYLYLLFGDDDNVLSLREWVFNTEAHPLPIWKV